MPRTPQQAIAAAAQQASDGPRFEVGTCLMQVRECYDVAARYPDAATAWEHARQQVTRDPNEIPRGVPVWWTGGAKGHGHVAISLGKGMCWSTDIKRPGYFDRVPIADIGKRWGLTLVGYSPDINGVTVWTKPVKRRPNADAMLAAALKGQAWHTRKQHPKRAALFAQAAKIARQLGGKEK